MIRAICVWIAQFCVRHITSWPWPNLLTGLGCGFLLLGLIPQFYSQLGTSGAVSTAACVVVGLAWALAWGWTPATAPASSRHSLGRYFLASSVLCLWTLAAPWIWPLHDVIISQTILDSRWLTLAYAALWASLMLGVPVWCVGRLTLCESRSDSDLPNQLRPSAACLLGVSLGLILGLIVTWNSLYVTAIIGCVVLCGARFWAFQNARSGAVTVTGSEEVLSSPVAGFDWGAVLSSIACGGLALWATTVLELLMPATIYTLLAVVSGALFGIALGSRLTQRPQTIDGRLFNRCCAVAAMLLMSAGFSTIVYRLVTLTGTVSQVWLLHALRGALITCSLAPLALVWAASTSRLGLFSAHSSRLSGMNSWGLGVMLALTGGAFTATVLLPFAGLTMTCYLWVWLVVGVAAVDLVRQRTLPRYSVVRVMACGCLCAVIAAPAVAGGVRPDLAGRLLFATNVFQADQAGIPRSELPYLDDARLVAQVSGDRGIYTAWKSTMTRHQIRENGIPRGTLSTDSQINPQDSSELLLALLPLTLHERPSRVAVLGLGASVPLQTSLACPIPEVVAVETDPQLVTLLKGISANTEVAAMWQDERLSLQTIDPVLWVSTRHEPFDVVISNPDPSSLRQGAAAYTREFYQRAANQLAADGIFCQRFQSHDYGPVPLQAVAATLRSVFRHVLAVETGPGELAWLATNSEAGFIRSELVERMQTAHVRSLMASVGWDWSVLLTLAAYDDECLTKVAPQNLAAANSTSNGWFCVSLPNELMRWAPKSEEMQRVVTAHAGKILNWVGEIGTDEDLLRRLAEVKGQQELVANFPDQFWGYRSQVRKQIASRPLSRIQQIKYESQPRTSEGAGLHPDDKRRLRYFQQLSKAIQTQQPSEILKLASYDAPYDPLVSLFMHEELAEVAAHAPELEPRVELLHRLHKLNYAPSFDPSVRNALSALRLVYDKPECVVSKIERWEVINGLLQALQYRWEIRVPSQNNNARLASRDVEENIILAERALQELPDLATEIGYSAEDCQNRQRVIQRKLLGPLRDYRERLRPLAAKQRYDAAAEETEGTLPTEEELQFPGADSEGQ